MKEEVTLVLQLFRALKIRHLSPVRQHNLDQTEEVHSILGKLPAAQIEGALESVDRTKQKLTPPAQFSEARFKEIDREIWDLRVAVLGEEEAAKRSPEDGKRSPVETY